MAQPESRVHWENVYRTRQDGDVSWFEPLPQTSLDFLRAAGLAKDAGILDVGAGASRLTGALLDDGYKNLTVLDIAEPALERARSNLGERAARVRWITADITNWQPDAQYEAWHDRAVFHFLTEEQDRAAYLATLTSAVVPGGVIVLATFSLDGPERCSGLPVQRYSPQSLAEELGARFQLQQSQSHDHVTPFGTVQHFQYSRFLKLIE